VRCLIVQNRLGADGRSRCIAELVALLNELGIEPWIVTLICANRQIGETFGLDDLRYRLSRPLPWPRYPSAYNVEILVTNLVAATLMARLRPDLVFNSNNNVSFLPAGPRYVHYFHGHPFEALADVMPRYTGGVWKRYVWLLRRFEQNSSPPPASRLVANSEFVRRAVAAAYGTDVSVIYPPAWTGELRAGRPDARRVVTLGSFHPDKRQLEQVEIAARMPEWRFVLMGGRASRRYTALVQRAAATLTNVVVVVNPTRQRITAELARASHFLHTSRLEGFGIAAVEAAAAGCVPVVAQAGGIREIVEPDALCFTNVSDAVTALRSSAGELGQELLRSVQRRLDRFSVSAYRSGLEPLLGRSG
jgi:glycosyltransferase involved in cell wall biosynthesis